MQEKQFVGISPAGVEWFVYRRDSDSDVDFIAKLVRAQERLESLKARAAQGGEVR